HKTLGFKWYAKCIARWQGSYRLIGSQLRNPQRFIPPTVGNKCKKTDTTDRYDIDNIKIRKDLAF
ncbi:MAG: hypothetical protein WC215_04575, partial [Bacilli bacterium]